MKSRPIRFGRPAEKKPTLDTTPITLQIESLSHDGRGVARHEGKTIFVSGALPNETVTATLTQRHKRFDEAEVTAIDVASEHRTVPVCHHYAECGGCQIQHQAAPQQIVDKEASVLAQLQRIGGTTPQTVVQPITSTPTGYRRAARLGVNQLQRNGEIIVGFRRRKSSKLLNIDTCPVLVDPLNALIAPLRDLLETLDHPKRITHAELQASDATVAVTLRCKPALSNDDRERVAAFADVQDCHIFLQTDQGMEPLRAPQPLSYAVMDRKLSLTFTPGDFLQVNRTVNEAMIAQALEWLDLSKDDTVLDLFCGLGNFTLPMALRAGEVLGVEGVKEMVERATQNAAKNQLTNCSFYCADLAEPSKHTPWFKAKYNKILLDPPRSGAYELIQQLPARAQSILYISCEPSALARDTKLLAEKGYVLKKVGLMDMFPQTSHVETMALFEKQKKR